MRTVTTIRFSSPTEVSRPAWMLTAAIAMLLFLSQLQAADDSGSPIDHYQEAREALLQGNKSVAEVELKLALEDDPLDANAHYLLAGLLHESGEEDQSIIGFQRAVTIAPSHAAAHYNLGTALLKRGESVLAARKLEEALSLRTDHVPTYNNLAKAYFQSGLPELAVASYRNALEVDAEDPVATRNLALLFASTEESDVENSTVEDRSAARPRQTQETRSSISAGVVESPLDPMIQQSVNDVRELLRDLPNIKLEWRGGKMVMGGWTSGPAERSLLDRVLAGYPDILDLSTDDVGDPHRLLEVDATIFKIIGIDSDSAGHNFLRRVEVNASLGDIAMGGFGWAYSAAISYEVNIANALDLRIAFLARPHLTALSGTLATFVAGGDIVYQVSGLNSGDIKPYPFGTTLDVTPTLLRSTDENGGPRIRLTVAAGRRTILPIAEVAGAEEGSTVFENISVTSEAVLDLGQTLILTGLSQRESRTTLSGVPGLRRIPVIKYLFSERSTLVTDLAIIILLTPRDPAYWDAKNRQDTADFVEKRKAFVKASRGTEEDMQEFREKYPDWHQLAPNRFASHFFLMENSEGYRKVSGIDLADEDLEIDLLGKVKKRK